ncbi:hypothetical protein PHIM7_124 [Sinorhizobium phage phiM7]|uniref:Uncharacterized protein n=2 Tax=Emdodecavirus TaxID=1980937 RepID=S5MPQ6_9CAUD|nr:hypothetical protein AB690_gp372 [Sinorhizobium phage phiM12]YP_009601249.1 hypothetical protein FDH46_gp354 [Sinorhizobium phage phiM7]AGR47815.1 hypothetical protein SmphiM12_183 [Sinorhizobium phage phiM12]AKF12670.1 hypothetical protein PHIM7_124 [Sinorhizobium phage phiM7]AKF13030.1 hypothetical protein PHIM19_125 [Sinorhizobium phage phiM19]
MTKYVVVWNVEGKELILQEAYSYEPRIFDIKEAADEVAKAIGNCRVIPVAEPDSDPSEN